MITSGDLKQEYRWTKGNAVPNMERRGKRERNKKKLPLLKRSKNTWWGK